MDGAYTSLAALMAWFLAARTSTLGEKGALHGPAKDFPERGRDCGRVYRHTHGLKEERRAVRLVDPRLHGYIVRWHGRVTAGRRLGAAIHGGSRAGPRVVAVVHRHNGY